MSQTEQLSMLMKIRDYISAPEHYFNPEITVDEDGTSLEIDGFLISIKAEDAPVLVNFDRPVTATEYTKVFPNVVKVISRRVTTLYLKAPAGQTSKVRIEALRGG